MIKIDLSDRTQPAKTIGNNWVFVNEYSQCYMWEKSPPLGTVSPGTDISVGDQKYRVLGHGKDTTAIMWNDKYQPRFAGTLSLTGGNDWCDIGTLLHFVNSACIRIPHKYLVPHKVKLRALNGDRPKVNMKFDISLLTIDLYRRYLPYIDESRMDDFALVTPTCYHDYDDKSGHEICFVRGRDGLIGWMPFTMIGNLSFKPFMIVDSAYTGYELVEEK